MEDAWGTAQDVIWWDGAGEPLPDGKFDLAYTVRSNDYRGVRAIQVTWVDPRLAAGAEAEVKVEVEAEVEVVDYRRTRRIPARSSTICRSRADVGVWREGVDLAHHATRITTSRFDLAPSRCLAIWTAPPGAADSAPHWSA